MILHQKQIALARSQYTVDVLERDVSATQQRLLEIQSQLAIASELRDLALRELQVERAPLHAGQTEQIPQPLRVA